MEVQFLITNEIAVFGLLANQNSDLSNHFHIITLTLALTLTQVSEPRSTPLE